MFIRVKLTWLLAVICIAGASALIADTTTPALPVSLSLKLEGGNPRVGQPASLRIALHDAKGSEVIADADTPVSVTVEPATASKVFVVTKGQASVTASITFERAGPMRVSATAPAVRGSSLMAAVLSDSPTAAVAVPIQASSTVEMARISREVAKPSITDFRVRSDRPRPSVRAIARGGMARNPAAAAPAPPPPPPAAPAPVVITQVVPGLMQTDLQLDLYLEPEPVFPTSAAWTANIRLFLRRANDGPLTPATTDVTVELLADRGIVTPTRVVIPAGQVSTDPNVPIRLTSSQGGAVVLRALSGIGVRDRLVQLVDPPPVALAVSVSPLTLSSNGREEGRFSVWLTDAVGIPTANKNNDVHVQLDYDRVTLKDATIIIPKGEISGSTTFTGASTGVGSLTARASGFREATVQLRLVFPWLAIILAAAGGAAGSIMARTGKSLQVIVRIVATGIIIGVLAYLLASFDVLSAIPGIPAVFAKVPFGAPAGALVIGFLAGYVGRPLLDLIVGKKKPTKR